MCKNKKWIKSLSSLIIIILHSRPFSLALHPHSMTRHSHFIDLSAVWSSCRPVPSKCSFRLHSLAMTSSADRMQPNSPLRPYHQPKTRVSLPTWSWATCSVRWSRSGFGSWGSQRVFDRSACVCSFSSYYQWTQPLWGCTSFLGASELHHSAGKVSL